MSKAQQFAQKQAELMSDEWRASFDGDECKGSISTDGRAYLRFFVAERGSRVEASYALSADDALALGKWLIDMFGE